MPWAWTSIRTSPTPSPARRSRSSPIALRDFDQKGTIPTDVYVPASFRGTLIEGGMGGGAVAWPWKDLKVTDFVAPPPDLGGFPKPHPLPGPGRGARRQAEDAAGGLQGVNLQGPDGKLYSLAIRPLLPDEQG